MKYSSTIYLKTVKDIEEAAVFRSLKKIMVKTPFTLTFQRGIYKLDFPSGGVKGQALLLASFKALSEDMMMANGGGLKGLVVPLASDKFMTYLDYVEENSISFLFEVGQTHPEIYQENMDLIDSIDVYSLETVEAYLEAGNSPAEASLRLFVHRNTVTYRIDHFIQQTGIDLKPFPNAVFCYFLIKKRCEGFKGQD